MNVQEFHDLDPVRARSPEWDYGVHWIEREGMAWPIWRVSWIVETGELYAVKLAGDNEVRVLGVVPKVGDYPYNREQTWKAFNDAQTIEQVMKDWAEEPRRPLVWAVERLRDHGFTTLLDGP
jgi:hypothetical protein